LGANTFKEEGRPVRELRNYGMTKELNPGESQDITLAISKRDLTYFDDGKHDDNFVWNVKKAITTGTAVNGAVIASSNPIYAALANTKPAVTDLLANIDGYLTSYVKQSLNGTDAYTTWNGFYGDEGHKSGWRVDRGTVFTVQIGDSSNTADLAARGVSAQFTYGDYASISAPEKVYTVSQTLSYDISVGAVTGANLIDITAQFNPSLVYSDSVINNIPASLNPTFLEKSYDQETGIYKATIALLKSGTVFSAADLTNVLTVTFNADGVADDKALLEGTLLSVGIYEVENGEGVRVEAGLAPATASTTVRNHLRFDVNGNKIVDNGDVSTIIYKYYLLLEGDTGWAAAQDFDVVPDGIINLGDILVIRSYIS
jgi:hypothetical protein